jgi:branched-chain amino acid transport system substrate-binding protein
MIPTTMGRYELREIIGRGGMATVFDGYDPRFRRAVAVKVMTQDLMGDEIMRARFDREAQTIAALEHPAIVPVYDFGEEQHRAYLVMRLMKGGTLADRLKKGAIPIAETVHILSRIGSALERAHQKGIIHRDLKPSNIMFDEYGDAFLGDFGIARLTESAVTLTGEAVIGTPAYMSPEQVNGDKELDGRSDIYALGVICFEMLTGQRPFQADTGARLMMKHVLEPVPDIYQIKPDLPPGMETVIARTLAKKPNERFASAGEMSDTLSRLLQGQERPALPIGLAAPPSPAPPTGTADTVLAASPALPPLDSDATEISPPVTTTEVMHPTFPRRPSPKSTGLRRGWTTATFLGFVVLVVLIGGGLLLANLLNRAGAADFSCDDAIGCVEIGPDDPIHIAYILALSGGAAYLGEDSRGGVEFAIEDRGGELLGHEILLTGEDSGCNAGGGQAAAQSVIADPTIVGIIGTNCSSEAEAAMPILNEAGLLMISPSNTVPRLTEPDPEKGGTWLPGFYRTAHNDLFQGRLAAEFAYRELGTRTAAIVHDNNPYSDSLRQVFAERFVELGGEVTYSGSVSAGDTDMSGILSQISANPPDILYFPIFEPQGNYLVTQARENADLTDMELMGTDGLLTASFPEAAGAAGVGIYLSGPAISGERYDTFLARWEEKYGGAPPGGFHAHAYDATNILLEAIEEVAKVGDDGTLLVGRQELREAIVATARFNGLTGRLTCNEHGDCATGEALAIYVLSEAEIYDGNWPPDAVYRP